MTVRVARFGDIPKIAALLEEGYRRSKYRDLGTMSAKEAKALLVQAIQRHGLKTVGGSSVFVSEHEGAVDGFIVGMLDRVYHVGNKLWANDVFFYVTPKGSPRSAGRLFDAFLDWADSIENAVLIQGSATDIIQDYDKVAALYRRKGMVQTGVIYERRTGKCRES